MSQIVRVEYQDAAGRWYTYKRIMDYPQTIRNTLEQALKAQRCKKARCVDDKTNRLIDILQE